ncbi:43344_t:CDS:2, partial [Gigaspora margarita]
KEFELLTIRESSLINHLSSSDKCSKLTSLNYKLPTHLKPKFAKFYDCVESVGLPTTLSIEDKNELENQQKQCQDTFYGKLLNNDEIDNLLRQLVDLYDEDSIEEKLNKTWKEAIDLYRKESFSIYEQIENQQRQPQNSIYAKMLNNDGVNNLQEQLAGLYDEDSLEVKLNKTWKEAIELCRKESLATYEQISKFLTQAFYNDNSLEEYEPFVTYQIQGNYSNDILYNKIDKHKEPVEDFNRLPKINQIDTSEILYRDVHIKICKLIKSIKNRVEISITRKKCNLRT